MGDKTLQFVGCLLAGLLAGSPAAGQRFFPDDPLAREPPPVETAGAAPHEVSGLIDAFAHLFGKPGERQSPARRYPAADVNTLGEVMDGPWYVNRDPGRMTPAALACGAGCQTPPSRRGPWRVLRVKPWGYQRGLQIVDANHHRYRLEFDPRGHPEMATGAAMISSRLLYALGYWTPETYLVSFPRSRLVVAPRTAASGHGSRRRRLLEESLASFLIHVPPDARGQYRAVAIRLPRGKPLGPFLFHGTRADDPNDVVPHEHRRVLRGLFVFAAWINDNAIGPLATADYLVHRDGVDFIRHYLTEFTPTLGSGREGEKQAWEGNEPLFRWCPSLKNLAGFGFYAPGWERTRYRHREAAGRFGSAAFHPEKWMANYESAPFADRLPADNVWAAAKVMAFSGEAIRAIVKTARYSHAGTGRWVVRCLVERRDRIGRAYLADGLPLVHFRLRGGRLRFENLGTRYGFLPRPRYRVQWYEFDNGSGQRSLLPGAAGFAVPGAVRRARPGSYWAAEIAGGRAGERVTAYLRKQAQGLRVVGIERRRPREETGPQERSHRRSSR